MKIDFNFSADDLAVLQDRAIERYKNSVVGHGTLNGAIIQVTGDNPADYTHQVMALALDGYTMHETLMPSLGGVAGHYLGFFVKPDNLKQKDLAELKIKVEADYRAELQRRYDECLRVTLEESIAREQRKAEKEAAIKSEKLRTKLEAEVIAALGQRPE
jgi:hypothetical protein